MNISDTVQRRDCNIEKTFAFGMYSKYRGKLAGSNLQP